MTARARTLRQIVKGEGAWLMDVYRGQNGVTPVPRVVVDCGNGAGRIRCIECGGDGNWGKYAPEIVGKDCPCVECKGSGLTYVSI